MYSSEKKIIVIKFYQHFYRIDNGGLKPGPVSSKTGDDCSPFGIGYAFYNNKLH